MNHEMKNLGKAVFAKIEKFILDKLEIKMRIGQVEQRFQGNNYSYF